MLWVTALSLRLTLLLFSSRLSSASVVDHRLQLLLRVSRLTVLSLRPVVLVHTRALVQSALHHLSTELTLKRPLPPILTEKALSLLLTLLLFITRLSSASLVNHRP